MQTRAIGVLLISVACAPAAPSAPTPTAAPRCVPFFEFLKGSSCPPEPDPVEPASCEPHVEFPAPSVRAPVGAGVRVVARVTNPTSKPVRVSRLALSPDSPLRFTSTAREGVVPAGTCTDAATFEIELVFVPLAVGPRATELTGALDDVPFTLSLDTMGLGPLLEVAPRLNLGVSSTSAGVDAELTVSNRGTVGSTVEVRVLEVKAANATTRRDELCLGRWVGTACEGVAPLTVTTFGRWPVSARPNSPGDKAWDVVLTTSQFDLPRLTVRVLLKAVDTQGCRLRPVVSTFDFGLPIAPQTERATVRLRNEGSTACLMGLPRADSRFSSTTSWRAPLLLAVGEEFTASVTASMRDASNLAPGTLDFEAPFDGQLVSPVTFRFTTADPSTCAVFSGPTLLFGNTPLGCTGPSTSMWVGNTCSRPLVLRSAQAAPPFFAQALPTRHTIIRPGSVVSASFRYAPMALGTERRDLTFDFGEATRTVTAVGVGVPPRVQVDTFQFTQPRRNDVVLVLDDSPSFARHHTNVRGSLDTYRRSWSSTRTRIAVTTTDVTDAGPRGRFRITDAGSRWAESNQPNFARDFDELTALSVFGAEHQSCLEAAVRAVTPPRSVDSSANDGFLRPGVPLTILCITDDVDHTSSREGLRTSLQNLDAGVEYWVVGPLSARCTVDAVDDGGYLADTRAVRGGTEDICGWHGFVFDVYDSMSQTTYFLRNSPRTSDSLVVAIDGLPVPSISNGRVNWTYDAAANAVRFSPLVATSEPGVVRVSYQLPCQ